LREFRIEMGWIESLLEMDLLKYLLTTGSKLRLRVNEDETGIKN
jgi:hypothetical protein